MRNCRPLLKQFGPNESTRGYSGIACGRRNRDFFFHGFRFGITVDVAANWVADPDNSYLTMPGTFLYGSIAAVDVQEAEDALRSLVGTVLRWTEDSTDPRAVRLRANWQAITNADPEEVAFCRAAGRMGLDPYDISSWPSGLVDLLETLSEENPPPIVTDFLSSAAAEDAAPLWYWVEQARHAGRLGAAAKLPPVPLKRTYMRVGRLA